MAAYVWLGARVARSCNPLRCRSMATGCGEGFGTGRRRLFPVGPARALSERTDPTSIASHRLITLTEPGQGGQPISKLRVKHPRSSAAIVFQGSSCG